MSYTNNKMKIQALDSLIYFLHMIANLKFISSRCVHYIFIFRQC